MLYVCVRIRTNSACTTTSDSHRLPFPPVWLAPDGSLTTCAFRARRRFLARFFCAGGRLILSPVCTRAFRAYHRKNLGVGATGSGNGFGRRFRPTTNQMETSMPENDARPLPPIPRRNTSSGGVCHEFR